MYVTDVPFAFIWYFNYSWQKYTKGKILLGPVMIIMMMPTKRKFYGKPDDDDGDNGDNDYYENEEKEKVW